MDSIQANGQSTFDFFGDCFLRHIQTIVKQKAYTGNGEITNLLHKKSMILDYKLYL